MKLMIISIAVLGLTATGFIMNSTRKERSEKVDQQPLSTKGVAVVELFTSEGCSSCPPADLLLPDLDKIGPNVITLAYHVDYWNRLGWKDPFSSPDYSNRQRAYATQLHLESVYTPQLVVNGKYELVGSNRSAASAAIQKVLLELPSTKIMIEKIDKASKQLLVRCKIEGALDHLSIIGALIEKTSSVDVKAGENSGRKLSHSNIVRSFVQQPAAKSMEFTLEFPDGLNDDNWEIVFFAQDTMTGVISGAVEHNPTQQLL